MHELRSESRPQTSFCPQPGPRNPQRWSQPSRPSPAHFPSAAKAGRRDPASVKHACCTLLELLQRTTDKFQSLGWPGSCSDWLPQVQTPMQAKHRSASLMQSIPRQLAVGASSSGASARTILKMTSAFAQFWLLHAALRVRTVLASVDHSSITPAFEFGQGAGGLVSSGLAWPEDSAFGLSTATAYALPGGRFDHH